MTISSLVLTGSVAGPKSDTDTHAISFPIMSTTGIFIIEVEDATGLETALVMGVDYSLVLDGTAPSTATLTFRRDLDAGSTWHYERDTALDQQTTFTYAGKYPSESHERALDRLTLIAQENDHRAAGRALVRPVSDGDTPDMTLPTKVLRASNTLGFDVDAAPIPVAGVLTLDMLVTPYMKVLLQKATAVLAKAYLEVREMARGHIAGLITANGTDTDHEIDIADGEARSAGNDADLVLATGVTIDIEDSGVLGLFSGAVAALTTYHVFIIKKDSDGTISAGFDIDIDCANIPSGYTAYRRIWSVMTDGGADIWQYTQVRDLCVWTEPDVHSQLVGASESFETVHAPQGLALLVTMNVYCYHGNLPRIAVVSSPYNSDEAPSLAAGPLYNAEAYVVEPLGIDFEMASASQVTILTDTAARVRMRASDANTTIKTSPLWHEDRRGRDD